MRRRTRLLTSVHVALVVGTLAVAGCSGSSDGVDPGTFARMRVVNAIADAAGVHLLVDDNVVTGPQGLPFGDATDYLTAIPGDRRVAVRALGATQPTATTTATLEAGLDYTIVAIGRASAGGIAAPRLVTITDAFGPPADWASVRLLHGAPSVGDVDVYLLTDAQAVSGATPAIAHVPYGEMTAPLPASGNRRVVVTRAGTKTVLIDVVNAVNAPGKRLVVFMDDVPGTSSSPPYLLRILPETANTTP